jgi:uncharacterized protein (TIGR03118 family)
MQRPFRPLTSGALSITALLFAATVNAQNTQHYTQTNLIADLPGVAAVTDPNLVNPWGLARSSSSPWWISDNGSGLSTLYSGTGVVESLVVTIPPADSNSPTGTPTGAIFNGGTGFQIASGKPALFLFVTEDGTISGWNPGVNLKAAVLVVNEKEKSVFKGATIASADLPKIGPTSFLYVADFRKGRIQIYDTSFHHVHSMEESFDDDRLPPGFAPFNVQNIGGNLFVTYALQDSAKHDEIDGAGLGYVVVYSPTGKLITRFEHGPWLNGPWGLAEAPSDFGAYSHDILVGQFGSGNILAFDPLTGHFKGTLQNASNQPIQIGGLWGLSFGNGGSAGPATTLYFSAGSNGEQDGLFGTITAVENIQGNDQ